GDIFSPAERGRYQGVFSGAWGFASVFGPTLGGWLTDQISWRATFYVNLPVGIIAVIALYLYFPFWHPKEVKRYIDWAGVVTLISCVVPLLLALTWVTDYGWSSARVELLLVTAVIMLGGFLYAETKAIEPIIAGSVLITVGSIRFARMDGATRPPEVLLAMITSGFGMGLLLPAYTVAVQNAAPPKHMGIATASATFFRSIGSTVGVAIFGSLLLTHYHHDFAKAVPRGVPQEATTAFSN